MSLIGDLSSSVVQRTVKDHPHMVLLLLIVTGGVIGYSYKVFAEKIDVDTKFAQVSGQFESVNNRITKLEHRVDLRFLETQLHSVESEIYSLERLVAAGEATDRDHDYLAKLYNEKGDIQRRIDVLPTIPLLSE